MPRSKFFVLLACFCISYSIALKVDEIHSSNLWINVPVPVSELQKLVSPILTVDTFGGTGWISIECFHLDRLRVNFPLGWFDTHTAAYIVKTKTYVSYKSAVPGQLIMSMDFDTSLSGITQALGCAATQSGIICLEADSMARTNNGLAQTLLAGDNSQLRVNFSQTANTTDPAFVKWIMDHYTAKYTQTGPTGQVYQAQDDGNFPVHPFQTLGVLDFSTTILSQRFGVTIPDSQVCRKGECFWSGESYLVDVDGVEIK